MKNKLLVLKQRAADQVLKLSIVGAVAITGVTPAFAVDAGVDAITGLATTAATYIAAAFGVAVLVAGGFWGIKMMRKAFNHSS